MWPLRALSRLIRRRKPPLDLLHTRVGPALSPPFRTLIHVGAHLAEERPRYEALGYRDVLWIEASSGVHARLVEALAVQSGAPVRHRAVCALVSDTDGGEAVLRESSNDGMSSSIFPLAAYARKRWPAVHETGVVERRVTRTLDSVAEEAGLAKVVDTLVVDVQGAELLVLKGAPRVLSHARAVIAEVSTRPLYDGGVLYPELRDYLAARGFVAMSVPHTHGDVLFLRADQPGA